MRSIFCEAFGMKQLFQVSVAFVWRRTSKVEDAQAPRAACVSRAALWFKLNGALIGAIQFRYAGAVLVRFGLCAWGVPAAWARDC
jgi:hypothetical protein